MNHAISTTQPYDAPRIEARTALEIPLIGVTSNIDSSAAFRSF
jgi:hypothetical protein